MYLTVIGIGSRLRKLKAEGTTRTYWIAGTRIKRFAIIACHCMWCRGIVRPDNRRANGNSQHIGVKSITIARFYNTHSLRRTSDRLSRRCCRYTYGGICGSNGGRAGTVTTSR